MGRRPCCSKEGLNRGPWSAPEDKILVNYIKLHGEGKWRDLPRRAGMQISNFFASVFNSLACSAACRNYETDRVFMY